MKRTILCVSLLALSLTACKNETKSDKETTSEEKSEQVEKENTENLPLAFQSESQYEIARLYLDLKTKFVEEDAYGARKIAEIMLKKFSDEEMKSIAQKIIHQENNIENQRKAFFQLSEMLEPTFAKNISGGKLYKQYCPMALDGKGAFWFSAEEKIMNPYFGDKMLHCGEVQETLK
ncbi:DUF3347 domain-containing protein [Mesonia aestuariivivens]|uniref:DUF3347 domain-containing protein n=1 Tax=Mesonia aestuariivivens TaxID=2796128 RepID=A0ABS6VZU9_9FLAO|nr:DUF3347 domain-containing protein [Mesonia aestuariivivens]MBW2961119.1 DUF3347 domain-containing protein [Mesonia aestuariivivens]